MKRAGFDVRRWMAVLDATCAWINPGLVLVAIALALLDLAVATQRWAAVRAAPPAPVRTVVVTLLPADSGAPVLAPGPRDMVGGD